MYVHAHVYRRKFGCLAHHHAMYCYGICVRDYGAAEKEPIDERGWMITMCGRLLYRLMFAESVYHIDTYKRQIYVSRLFLSYELLFF